MVYLDSVFLGNDGIKSCTSVMVFFSAVLGEIVVAQKFIQGFGQRAVCRSNVG